MDENMKMLQIKKYNHDYPIVLTYDKCKTGESQYGPWNFYGVEYESERQGLFAEVSLHQKLKKYGKGTKLIIRRDRDDNGQLEWKVIPAKGNNRSNQKAINYLDDRTRDIHRQVVLKIATISIGQTTKPWTTEDLQEIKLRMEKLLDILDGSCYDDLPF